MRSFEKYMFYILLIIIGFIIGANANLDGNYAVIEHATSLTSLEGIVEDLSLQPVEREVMIRDVPFAPIVEMDRLPPPPPSISSLSTSSDEDSFVRISDETTPIPPPIHRIGAPPTYSLVAPSSPPRIKTRITSMEEVPTVQPYKANWTHRPIILRSGHGKSSNGLYIGQEVKVGHTPSKKKISKPSGKTFYIAHPIHVGIGGRIGVYFNPDLLTYIRAGLDYNNFIIKDETDTSIHIFSLCPSIGIDWAVGESTFVRVCVESVFHSTTFKKTSKIKNHSHKCFYIGIGMKV